MSESVLSQSTDHSTDSDSRVARTNGRTHEDLGGDERETGCVSNARESKQCSVCPMPSSHTGRHAESNSQRLSRHIDASAGPDACWPWTGGRDQGNYGHTYLYRNGRRVKMKASRAVYIATHGELPADIFVLHSCDNPPCCNPAHLRPGTHRENMHERNTRGAGYARGADNHNTVFVSDETVAALRAEYRWNVPGFGTPALAARYGLNRGLVQQIVTRVGRWADVA